MSFSWNTMASSAFTVGVLIAARASMSVAVAMFKWEQCRYSHRPSSQHSRRCKVASWSTMRVAVLLASHLVMKYSQSSLVLSLDTFGPDIWWGLNWWQAPVVCEYPCTAKGAITWAVQYPPWRKYILQGGDWAPPWTADSFASWFYAWSLRYVILRK